MSLIADASFMRNAGVLKMVRLPVAGLTEQYPDAQQYIFLVRPNLSIVEQVVEAIRYALPQLNRDIPLIIASCAAEHPRKRLIKHLPLHSPPTRPNTVYRN